MVILAVIDNYRKKVNTAHVVQLIEARMQTLAAQHTTPLDFETLFLGDLDIRTCRGCRACFDRGEDACPLKDDVPLIRAKIDAADALLLASPVYVDDVSGLVKTWMDRLTYVRHRPAFADKCAYLLATVADSPTQHTLRTLDIGLRTWGIHIVGQAGYKMGALMPQDEVEKRFRGEAAQVAQTLFHAVAQQRFKRPSFLSLMIFKIQQRAWQQEPADTLDYAY